MFLELPWIHAFFALTTCGTLDAAMCLAHFVGINPCLLFKIINVLCEVHGQLALGVQELNEEVCGCWVVTLQLKLS
jgi:hypothetical protein